MIQANELRIGSWVKGAHSNDLFQVESVGEYGINAEVDGYESTGYAMEWQDLESIVPIPLTIEILLKSGFKEAGLLYQKGWIHIDKNLSFLNTKLEYVHQLQNLYFALSGKELNIKTAQLT